MEKYKTLKFIAGLILGAIIASILIILFVMIKSLHINAS